MTAKIGPIKLAEGISRFNAVTYLYACIICIGILAGLNFIQPYILSVVLDIPRSEQGTISGSLAFMQEIIAILSVSFFGVLSDRIGRRPVMVFGTMVVAVGFALFPYASNINELFIFRSVFAIGAAALSSVLAIIVNDYPTEKSRGKFVSLHSVLNALGVAIFAAFLGRLPSLFMMSEWVLDGQYSFGSFSLTLHDPIIIMINNGLGYDPITAGRYTMLFVAAVAFLSGIIFAIGLKGGTPESLDEKPTFKHLVATAIRSMRNLRISLAFAATLLARADVSVNGIFISLWAATSAVDLGITTGEAFKQVVPVIVVTNLLSIVWAFLFGSMIDRINRVTAMVIAMGLGAIAYGSIIFVDTPLNYSYLPIFILISASAIGTVIATGSLIGQEAPVRERGSVIGVSAFFGACGILIATSVGGILFDTFGPKGPFLLICSTHALIFFGAVYVRIKSPGDYYGSD